MLKPNKIIFTCLVVLSFLYSASLLAKSITPLEVIESVEDKISTVVRIAKSPVIVSAVIAQNSRELTMDEILIRDQNWKSSPSNSELKIALQSNPPGRYLKSILKRRSDIYNEAFLTDKLGANVAAYPPTSDYWQGDEEKFTASYQEGNGKTVVGKIEHDESTNTNAVQISVPVISKGSTIGVLIMGIKLSHAESVALIKRRLLEEKSAK